MALATVGAAALLVACGGDGGSSTGSDGALGGSAVSIEEFCDKIDALESAVAPDDLGAAVIAIQGLVDSAPTPEVRDALETLLPVLTEMTDVDENDPDAFARLMAMAMDPKIAAAGEVLERFGTEQCGFDAEESSGLDANDDVSDIGVSDFTFEDGADPATAVFEASTIREFLEATASRYLNGGSITSVSVLGEGDGYLVSVDASNFPGGVAAVPICELLVEWYDTHAPGVDVTLEVMTESLPAVNRDPGGICLS